MRFLLFQAFNRDVAIGAIIICRAMVVPTLTALKSTAKSVEEDAAAQTFALNV
jgi:hypothetical protein